MRTYSMERLFSFPRLGLGVAISQHARHSNCIIKYQKLRRRSISEPLLLAEGMFPSVKNTASSIVMKNFVQNEPLHEELEGDESINIGKSLLGY